VTGSCVGRGGNNERKSRKKNLLRHQKRVVQKGEGGGKRTVTRLQLSQERENAMQAEACKRRPTKGGRTGGSQEKERVNYHLPGSLQAKTARDGEKSSTTERGGLREGSGEKSERAGTHLSSPKGHGKGWGIWRKKCIRGSTNRQQKSQNYGGEHRLYSSLLRFSESRSYCTHKHSYHQTAHEITLRL